VTKGDYRLILMDIQMPVMDGIESTKRIRALEHETGAPRVVIIGVSANSDSDTRNEAMAAGMDGFLPKPINVDRLKRLLKTTYCRLEVVSNEDASSSDE
jgi:two-component system, sensor histidine kinase and response regulator